jgi:hypothetical protein
MRRRNGRIVVLALMCVLATGCGARSGTGGTGGTARGDANVITAAEIDGSGHADALSLVQSLRPRWLRVRGASSPSGRETVKVYLDGSLLGNPQSLRQISTHSVGSVRYLTGLEATQRYGLDHGAGAIIVSTQGRTSERPGCCD